MIISSSFGVRRAIDFLQALALKSQREYLFLEGKMRISVICLFVHNKISKMRNLILLIFFVFFYDNTFSQIEIYNYKDEKTNNIYSGLNLNNYSIIKEKISVKRYYNFSDTLSDNNANLIKQAILNHDKILHDKWVKKNFPYAIKRIDSLSSLEPSPIYKFKVLGKYQPDSEVISVFVLREVATKKTSFRNKELYLYLLNFNTELKLISSAKIGKYLNLRLITLMKIKSRIYIKSNIISIVEKSYVTSDLDIPHIKNDNFDKRLYKVRIKSTGEIEMIE